MVWVKMPPNAFCALTATNHSLQVFNEEAFMLSHGHYNGSKVSVRVMHYLEWVNSKVFFYSMRRRFFPALDQQTPPVMIHMYAQTVALNSLVSLP